MDLDKIKERFSGDLYATECTGIEIKEADTGYAKCLLNLERKHQNAMGGTMGGVIFTLCDFAFAVASNGLDNPYTMTLSANTCFYSQPKDKTLYAEAVCKKNGGHTCFYEVTVTDGLGNPVAKTAFTGYKTGVLK